MASNTSATSSTKPTSWLDVPDETRKKVIADYLKLHPPMDAEHKRSLTGNAVMNYMTSQMSN